MVVLLAIYTRSESIHWKSKRTCCPNIPEKFPYRTLLNVGIPNWIETASNGQIRALCFINPSYMTCGGCRVIRISHSCQAAHDCITPWNTHMSSKSNNNFGFDGVQEINRHNSPSIETRCEQTWLIGETSVHNTFFAITARLNRVSKINSPLSTSSSHITEHYGHPITLPK